MTELLRQATDDQLALAICFGGVMVSALIMYFSQHVGAMTAQMRAKDAERATRLRLQRPEVAAEPARPFPNERAA